MYVSLCLEAQQRECLLWEEECFWRLQRGWGTLALSLGVRGLGGAPCCGAGLLWDLRSAVGEEASPVLPALRLPSPM